ncbi:23S rRNA (guanosine(2251)-2'-O)-methyltransferase RlmB [Nitrosophilus kaiyonis]|uniref:23S rRNA (guanosine(2251)-2'-O)-methyltransferase RlmB n=1 Tax=Nitrosophilus kaiyonis TaxID=2930200 RepID=UPI002493AC54|nr:23S rRNA (guanosine(2251)-2'-O)-methyltransferase RlmB [Nitrosophilus kaiyonis]
MIVYGKQIFFYILDKHPELIKKVIFSKKVDEKIFKRVQKLGKEILNIDNKKAQSLCHGGNHQGFLLEIEEYSFYDLNDVKDKNFIVVLYGVTDVGNIGSIVRSAYALGADALVISNIKNIKMEGIIRVSSGAALDLPIIKYFNIYDLINELKMNGFEISVASLNGVDVRKVSFNKKRVLILGSEGEGIPLRLEQKSDKKIKIVMEREFDSLNVSAAAAILIDRMR